MLCRYLDTFTLSHFHTFTSCFFSTHHVSMFPLPLMSTPPRGTNSQSGWKTWPRSFSLSKHWKVLCERCIRICSELLSMRLAVLTASPNKQYRGFTRPTTPATTSPLCMPHRMRMGFTSPLAVVIVTVVTGGKYSGNEVRRVHDGRIKNATVEGNSTLKYIKVHQGSSRYIKVHHSTPQYTTVHNSTKQYTIAHNSTQ